VLVDALLGTGFAGQVREPLATVIRAINALRKPTVIAIDVPSGLDADTGQPGGIAVEADQTITLLALKPGLVRPEALRFTGHVTVADIGIPLPRVLPLLAL
jgi:NAD(P)H-hydrate epimerase